MPMSSYVSHAYLRRPTPAIINNSELFSMAWTQVDVNKEFLVFKKMQIIYISSN
jgi:hypothetical protein